jgi:hypothetical protein
VRVQVFPADVYACGHLRMIWPARLLAAAGHDVQVISPEDRKLELRIEDDHVTDIVMPDVDVVVLQRVTHRYIAEAVPILRAKGVTVVIDIDDDLNSVHPSNPAYAMMHPKNENKIDPRTGQRHHHSWHHLTAACRAASLVTTSTPGLINVYARHGRGQVIYNYLPDSYYGHDRQDSNKIGWPAALVSHPDDPAALGGAVARLVSEGASFSVVGDPTATGRAFGLQADPQGIQGVGLDGWPDAVATIGIGIAPLADSKFNRSKSWLKPLEMSALGVPWVGSMRPEYVRLNARGAGRIADNPRRWYREIERLLRSPAARQELSAAGLAVAEELRLRDHAWRWYEAWTRARDLDLRDPVDRVLVQ